MRDSRRQLGIVVLVGLMGGSCSVPGETAAPESLEPEGLGLEETRELVRAYNREVLSSTIDFDRPSVLKALREERPIFQLLRLFNERDPVVERLGGTFWGIVCQEVGPGSFVEPLIQRLGDRDPRSRAFACEALGLISAREDSPARRAVPALIALLEDQEPVPGYSGPPPVAAFAASALAYMGRSDGVEVLLKSAETQKHWPLSYGHHFRAFSGEDFGEDLEAWKSFFAENGAKD